jgi:hypothetical protein
MPYVVTTLLAEVAFPARYSETPAAGTIIMLAVPRFTTLIAVPTDHDTEVLLAMVKAKFDALVE